MKIKYLVGIHQDNDGLYSIDVPGVPNHYSSGDNFADAMYMAKSLVFDMVMFWMQEDAEPVFQNECTIDVANETEGTVFIMVAVNTEDVQSFINTFKKGVD